jgi:LPPG:FO 2-phospho-L-lactate transferase
VNTVALSGGVGAGKFLRGLERVVGDGALTIVVNTGDDVSIHGLHVSPDIDSVTYWLAGVSDRDRGWGREGETFRATTELRDRFDAPDAWFNLGDLDLATHLFRAQILAEGGSLSEATRRIAERFGLTSRLVPMSDDPIVTRIDAVDEAGRPLDLHLQEYWVRRGARDHVQAVRYERAPDSRPAPGVLEALTEAEAVVICPSNPVASIGPILAVPGVSDAVALRRSSVVGVSPIVGGTPLRGMADKLLPVAGADVSAVGAAGYYRGLLSGWVIDERDRHLAPAVKALGLRVAVTDTIMDDDAKATALARTALDLL